MCAISSGPILPPSSRAVIVRVQERCEEDDWIPSRRSCAIAAIVNPLRVCRIIQLKIDRHRLGQTRIGIDHDVVQLAADAVCSDRVNRVRLRFQIVVVASDHIDVQLGDDVVDWDCGVICKISGAVEPQLLAGMPDEKLGPLGFRAAGKCASKTDESDGSRTVVVRRVIYSICLACGKYSLRVSGVIIVGTE